MKNPLSSRLVPPLAGLACVLGLAACQSHLAFGGCAYRLQSGECYARDAARPKDADLVAATAAAVDSLLQGAREPLPRDRLLAVASVVDLNALESTSPLGRLLGEQIAARLTQQGYPVAEIKFRDTWLVQDDNGEFRLSRDLRALRDPPRADTLSVGTYTAGSDAVYVTLKLVRVADGVALSSYSFRLPLGPNTLSLLED